MKVPLSWLKEFVDITIAPDELSHILTMAGLEVAAVHVIGLEGAELPWDPEKIVVANILEVKPHPNADRLVLADVEYGGPQPHTVVTGAPNLFPYKGQGALAHPLKSVFAREGAQLYDGHKEGKVITTLKSRPVRGVMSDAMLCSEKELGISDEHEGILFLEDDAPVGIPLRDVLGEVVLEIDLTPNLARCLSIIGFAREVAALTGVPLRMPDPQVQMDGPPIEGQVRVTVEDAQLCPRFTAALVEGITIGPSPQWMQRRLTHAGMRPVSNIVDISNYVMLEWGQPTHAFDADCVQDQHLVVRLAQPGERLTTLDGKARDLSQTPDTPLLVCDPSGPLSLAGVMGGETSEVSDTTTRVLFEAAIWHPPKIRRMAQFFKLPSEASRRFERGVDWEVVLPAQRRALELMRTLAGGTVAHGIVDVYPHPWQSLLLELPPREVERILGISLSAEKIAVLLQSLGFGCTVNSAGNVRVEVPSFRQDVTQMADLCEEVARAYGYDQIPITLMGDELPESDAHPELEIEHQVRDLMVAHGLNETITYSLTGMAAVARLTPFEAQPERYLRLTNAISPEREYLRRSLLPILLEALAVNLRERDRALLFDIGRVFLPRQRTSEAAQVETARAGEDDRSWLPVESLRLGIVMAGPRTPLNWHTPESDKSIDQPYLDFFDLKGIIETLFARLDVQEQITFEPLADDERFHPGRAARLTVLESGNGTESGTLLGVMGELHPAACERLELEAPRALAAELDMNRLITLALTQRKQFRSISRYPANVQDIAVIVTESTPAEQVAAVIRRGAGDLLESLTLFDRYSGPQIGEGNVSLAYRMAFRARDRNLSDDAVAKVRGRIIKLLERELAANIRA